MMVAIDCFSRPMLNWGNFIWARTQNVVGTMDPVLSEVLGFREALSWMKKQQLRNVIMETDAKASTDGLRNSMNNLSRFVILKDA